VPHPREIDLASTDALLKKSIPAWRLTPDGTVVAANLLAFWLFSGIRYGAEHIHPADLLGANVLNIFSRDSVLQRIPADDNAEFFAGRVAVLQEMTKRFGDQPSYQAFRRTMLLDGRRAEIYTRVTGQIEHSGFAEDIWHYKLRIGNPEPSQVSSQYLSFDVLASRLAESGSDKGLFVEFQPADDPTRDELDRIDLQLRSSYERMVLDLTSGLITMRTERDVSPRREKRAEAPETIVIRFSLIDEIDGGDTLFWLRIPMSVVQGGNVEEHFYVISGNRWSTAEEALVSAHIPFQYKRKAGGFTKEELENESAWKRPPGPQG